MAEPYSPTGASSTGTAYGANQTANYQMTSPYAMEALGKAQAAASTPYQAFTTGAGGEAGASSARVASMNPMETNAYTGIASMGFQNPMQQGMDLTQQASGQFGLPAAQQYMDPYQQQVVEQQKKAAIQDYARSLPGQTAAAYQAGAGRGTRAALVQAEGQRNLQNNLQDIQAKGSQSAYENAQQQYNADMARKMTGAGQLYNQGTDIYGRASRWWTGTATE